MALLVASQRNLYKLNTELVNTVPAQMTAGSIKTDAKFQFTDFKRLYGQVPLCNFDL